MKPAAFLLLACVSLGAQPASIQGTVVIAATGQPLSGVHVRLVLGTYQAATAAYGAISDRAGRFSIAALQPGSYVVSAERNGFVHLPGKRRTLKLELGQRMADYRIEMAQRAVIAGRVVDEYGDPLQNVTVQAVTVSEDTLTTPGLYGRTDDRGEFRLRGAPGKYYVEARPPEYGGFGAAETVYGPAFFPNAASKERAVAVEAVAGGDTTGIEIRLSPRRSFTVSGIVRGAPDEASRASVSLDFGESPNRITNSQGIGVRPDGKFTFNRLRPGFYRVYAQCSSGSTQLTTVPLEFNLESADVTNLELVLTPAGELTGTLEIAGAPDERLPAATRTVRLQPEPFGHGRVRPGGGELDKEGSFRITNVPPSRFRVHVDPLPENAYVKGVELDGTAAAGDVIDFSRGVGRSRVKILVGRNGGQLSGTVKDPEGSVDPAAMVLLVANPHDFWPDAESAKVDPEGKYSFKAIRPGKYRLFAVDPFYTPGLRDVWKPMAERAETIEIKEGDRITKDLKVMVKEEAHAARKP